MYNDKTALSSTIPNLTYPYLFIYICFKRHPVSISIYSSIQRSVLKNQELFMFVSMANNGRSPVQLDSRSLWTSTKWLVISWWQVFHQLSILSVSRCLPYFLDEVDNFLYCLYCISRCLRKSWMSKGAKSSRRGTLGDLKSGGWNHQTCVVSVEKVQPLHSAIARA